jgi:hypothetical protein
MGMEVSLHVILTSVLDLISGQPHGPTALHTEGTHQYLLNTRSGGF